MDRARSACVFLCWLSLMGCEAPAEVSSFPPQPLALEAEGQIVRDRDGIVHIFGQSEHDVLFLQGYAHARDRLFQMDVLRHQAEGSLAELLGEPALSSDVELRTFGIRRAAERSLPMLSAETRAGLTAYAAGVNAYIEANPLPPEYSPLEITQLRPWSELDSVAAGKLLTFQLSFDINDLRRTQALQAYIAEGAKHGFDGEKLYSQDVARIAPFEPIATLPDAAQEAPAHAALSGFDLGSSTLRLIAQYLQRLHAAPHAEAMIMAPPENRGSNGFVVSGALSRTGVPMLAGDPHLPLAAPSFLYENHLRARADGIDIAGASLPGVPYVLIGHNQHVTWTATQHPADVTDVYREKLVADASSASGWSTSYRGSLEAVIALPQTFRVNALGDGVQDNLADVAPRDNVPAAVLIVPRRNQGPLLQLDAESGTALSVQHAGFSGTRELDSFQRVMHARTQHDFERALRRLDVGSQNYVYADVAGNIGYFVAGEFPLREDLQAGAVVGLPPWFIRDGEGGNEWVAATPQDDDQALPYEIVPYAELARTVNPARGFIVSANNEPFGTLQDNDALNQMRPNGGIAYVGTFYAPGTRARRIDTLLEQRVRPRGRLTTADLQAIQADTVMHDAVVFAPWIIEAFDHAQLPDAHPQLAAAASEPRVREAIERLRAWDGSTPTGIREGYDAGDVPGQLAEPSGDEVAASISATIYSVWRNQFLRAAVAAPLERMGLPLVNSATAEVLAAARNLLDNFDEQQGIGRSGVNFFDVPGIDDAATRRDLILVQSLSAALDQLAGDAYASVYQHSHDQNDYRWGLLHRVTLEHPLGAPFSLPPAGGAFPAPLGDKLPGIAIDGGFSTVDTASNQLLVDSPDGFKVKNGPVRRYVSRPRLDGRGFVAVTSVPGGASGVLGSAFYVNLLEGWLSNRTIPLRHDRIDILHGATDVTRLSPE